MKVNKCCGKRLKTVYINSPNESGKQTWKQISHAYCETCSKIYKIVSTITEVIPETKQG